MTWLQYLEHRVKKWDRCFPTSTSKSDSVAAVLLTTSTLISIQANTALGITGSGDRTSFYSPKNKPASVCVLLVIVAALRNLVGSPSLLTLLYYFEVVV